MEITGADGVMSSEGLLGNPKMFSEEGDRLFREDFARSQLQTADDFLRILQSHKLPRPLFQVVRSHLFKMLYRFSDAPKNTDLRMQLANGDFETMKNVVVQLHVRMSVINYDTALGEELGMIGKTDWYYRHRDEKAQQRINSIPRKKIIRSAFDVNSPPLLKIEKKKDATGEELSLKLKLLKLKLSEKMLAENSSVGDEVRTGSGSFSSFMSNRQD
jgi:Dihydrouridine synthase (Dus)